MILYEEKKVLQEKIKYNYANTELESNEAKYFCMNSDECLIDKNRGG